MSRSTYHHGDLRNELLQSALMLLNEEGIQHLTLREVARRAGVTHNAPYNHFADKAALIEALVTEGFSQFDAALQQAYEQAPSTPAEEVIALGVAYVRFAMEHPALFRLLFRPELQESTKQVCPPPNPLQGGFGLLVHALTEGQARGVTQAGDPLLLALTSWSTVHGLACLILDGAAGQIAETIAAGADLAKQVTTVLRFGLQLRSEPLE